MVGMRMVVVVESLLWERREIDLVSVGPSEDGTTSSQCHSQSLIEGSGVEVNVDGA